MVVVVVVARVVEVLLVVVRLFVVVVVATLVPLVDAVVVFDVSVVAAIDVMVDVVVVDVVALFVVVVVDAVNRDAVENSNKKPNVAMHTISTMRTTRNEENRTFIFRFATRGAADLPSSTMMLLSTVAGIYLCLAVAVAVEIWVIVLDSRTKEFDELVLRWRPLLPNVTFNKLPAVNLKTRGLGLCLSFLAALVFDKASARPTVIFESDARPFENVHYGRAFDERFDSFDIYFLGGHHVTPRSRRRRVVGWTPIRHLYGTYGTLIPSHARLRVTDLIREHCVAPRSAYAIDDLLSECLDAAIATPLLVDHPRLAFSETWKKKNFYPWAGSRHWWEFEDPRGFWNCSNHRIDKKN